MLSSHDDAVHVKCMKSAQFCIWNHLGFASTTFLNSYADKNENDKYPQNCESGSFNAIIA